MEAGQGHELKFVSHVASSRWKLRQCPFSLSFAFQWKDGEQL